MSLIHAILAFAVLAVTTTTATADERKPGEAVEVEIAKGLKMKFCWIPAGECQLGSPKEEQDYITKTFHDGKRPAFLDRESESVRGKHKTNGFWMAKYPVTQAEWEAVMGKNTSFFSRSRFQDGKVEKTDIGRFPVETVSWNDCQEFLKKVNEHVNLPAAMGKGRIVLPHEDQWEYACRGGKGNKQPFYFGNELNGTQANLNGEHPYGTSTKGPYLERTTAVGSYEKASPHPWGLCDMCGNVFQLCGNKYDDQDDRRVLRAGSWIANPVSARSAHRFAVAPDDLKDNIIMCVGLRVVVVP